MSEQTIYRYTPRDDGGYIAGLPRRDITASDLASLHPWDLRNGVDCGLYQPVTDGEPVADDQPVADSEPVTERRARR